LTPDRFHIDHNEYFEGAPTVVVEIHSPGGEAYEKLPFYVKLAVPEVWIVDRDSKVPEVSALVGDRHEPRAPDRDGWIASSATGVHLRGHPGGKLALRVAGEPSTMGIVPED
jgi:Uma2 family endonuclease